eukprot:scaffold1489_cov194-Cylindrotheca_fusiformis.AAC.14
MNGSLEISVCAFDLLLQRELVHLGDYSWIKWHLPFLSSSFAGGDPVIDPGPFTVFNRERDELQM